MAWLVIRVRGDIGVDRRIKDTMSHLNLTRVNHAVIINENDTNAGMLQKAKDYITWGEISQSAIAGLLKERGRMAGDKPVDDSVIKDNSDLDDIEALAKGIAAGTASIKDVEGLKRVFRLHPPRGSKGWGGIKRAYTIGGALGFRGEAIEDLASRMI